MAIVMNCCWSFGTDEPGTNNHPPISEWRIVQEIQWILWIGLFYFSCSYWYDFSPIRSAATGSNTCTSKPIEYFKQSRGRRSTGSCCWNSFSFHFKKGQNWLIKDILQIRYSWILDCWSGNRCIGRMRFTGGTLWIINIFQEEEEVISPNIQLITFTMAQIMEKIPPLLMKNEKSPE